MRTRPMLVHSHDPADEPKACRRRRRALAVTVAAVAFETAVLWSRTGRLGGRVFVRCRAGHLFTALWIPAVSFRSLRLGPWRFQRCPVGGHWSIVTPVRESELSATQREAAREHTSA